MRPHPTDTSGVTAHRSRGGWVGFGLLGVLVVMAIMFYLYFGPTGPNGKSAVEAAKESQDRAIKVKKQLDLSQLAQVVAAHELQTGQTPETLEEMGMETNPAFRDTWGTMLRFEVTDGNPRELVITSAGPDRQFGTADDETDRTRMPI